ncbi:MAG: tRNA pseudouridine(38-40) synthase TruA [Terracidiphilus sp.]|nr:tRNA pseudouridine(38-40) synthase TruA [Terracidiphilus sp.]
MTQTATQAPAQRTWKIVIAYDGSDFRGWQVQPGLPTIQGELQSALDRIVGEAPLPQGSGRTDAGVHAVGQVASFALNAPIPPGNLLRALNRTLPPSIRVLDAAVVPDAFHARHDAVAKAYEYRLMPGAADRCPPFQARYVYACPWTLNRAALDAAAARFVGEHDFRSFAASDPDQATRQADDEGPRSTVREIFSSSWEERLTAEGLLLVYRVRGNGFLHHMVRNLVGTMVEIGRGFWSDDSIPAILAACNRSAAGPTAPARGLFLHSVEYGG